MIDIPKKEPIDICYSYVKDLAEDIPIYKFIMNEDKTSIPNSYLLIRPDVTNDIRLFGSGKCQLRKSDCDFILVSKGASTSSKSTHHKNIKKIKDLFNLKEIPYSYYDLGYDDNLKSSQVTFSITVYYHV